MSMTEQILDVFRESQGWSDRTVLDLALTYIENQEKPEDWRDYLVDLALVDNDMDESRFAAEVAPDAPARGLVDVPLPEEGS